MKEMYFSVDVECDGIVPSKNSMLSIGAVAINGMGDPVDEFYITLKELVNTYPDPVTEKFWKSFPEAYKKTRDFACDPYLAMVSFETWVKSKKAEKNVFVAYPAAFDFGFVNYYFLTLLGRNPFGFNVLDIRSFAMGITGNSFTDSAINKLPMEWQSDLPHTHVAIDDAKEQGQVFSALLKASKEANRLKRAVFHELEEIVDSGGVKNVQNTAALATKLRNWPGNRFQNRKT